MSLTSPPSVVVQPIATDKAARELKLWCFHQERRIGCFHPALHTDIRTVVEALCRESTGRGRPITLSADRTAAVEAALHADGTHSSMAALRSAVVSWRSGTREAADAAGVNRYYDEWRVQGYTQKLEAPQQALCLRCLELSGLHPEAMSGPPLVLDLGCGSGLSTTPLAQYALVALRIHTTSTPRAHHAHTPCTRHAQHVRTPCTLHAHAPRARRRGCMSLGMDLSLEMLREARRRGCEVVQADMSLPLPLRAGGRSTVEGGIACRGSMACSTACSTACSMASSTA